MLLRNNHHKTNRVPKTRRHSKACAPKQGNVISKIDYILTYLPATWPTNGFSCTILQQHFLLEMHKSLGASYQLLV